MNKYFFLLIFIFSCRHKEQKSIGKVITIDTTGVIFGPASTSLKIDSGFGIITGAHVDSVGGHKIMEGVTLDSLATFSYSNGVSGNMKEVTILASDKKTGKIFTFDCWEETTYIPAHSQGNEYAIGTTKYLTKHQGPIPGNWIVWQVRDVENQ